MNHDQLTTAGWCLGLAMMVGGFVLNNRLGGDLWDWPIDYKPAAMYVYFGGVLTIMLGVVVADSFL